MQRRQVVAAAAMMVAAGTAVALTLPAVAGTTPSGARRAPAAGAGDFAPQVLAAMARDLGGTTSDARARLVKQRWASNVTSTLSAKTGGAFAGSWLSKDGQTLNVAVTDAAMAATVNATGAKATVVERSQKSLASAKSQLDLAATKADRALPGWYVDVATNKLVVQALPGDTARARALVRRSGVATDAVTVKTTNSRPKPLADVRGADPYFIELDGGTARCSIGFSVEGGFVTAGHCGTPGTATTGANQLELGTVKASVFPGNADMGFVEITGDFTPRPVVNDFEGNELPVAGSQEAQVGAAICKSGSTTGTTCGRILAKNQTVNYPEGAVTGLTQTDVCAEGGDSGGPWLAGDQAQGVTSGGSGDCTVGGETFFQPIAEILETNNLTLLTTADDGGNPPPSDAATPPPGDATPPPPGDATPPPADDATPPPGDAPPPANAEACANLEAQVTGDLANGDLQRQPGSGSFQATAGEHVACLSAPDGADFDVALQQRTRLGFRTVAAQTGAGDKVLTFDGAAGTYRYVVLAKGGSGQYTLSVNVP